MRNWGLIKIFENDSTYVPAERDLRELVDLLLQYEDSGNTSFGAGYTYFGQFIDHDLTFLRDKSGVPKTYDLKKPPAFDISSLLTLRKPALDLDSVYGGGLADSAVLYDRDSGKFILDDAEFAPERDLPRDLHHRPLIADNRNDQNLLVAQMQVLFMSFHNKIAQIYCDRGYSDAEEIFSRARREVIKIYQYLVLHDFLKKLLTPSVYAHILAHNSGHLTSPDRENPHMVLEFSAAAFRLHSLVRPTYRLNESVRSVDLEKLLQLTGNDRKASPEIFPLKKEDEVDWRFFFDFDNYPEISRINKNAKGVSFVLNRVMRDSKIEKGDMPVNMLELNILRGIFYQLASGQQIYQRLKTRFPSLCEKIGLQPPNNFILGRLSETNPMKTETPLWIYLMLESTRFRIGNMGGWIVADTIRTAALNSDVQLSVLENRNPSQLFEPFVSWVRAWHKNELSIEDVIMYTYNYR